MNLRRTIIALAFGASTVLFPSAGNAQATRNALVTSAPGAYLAGQAATFRSDLRNAAWYFTYVLQSDPANVGLASRIFSLWVDTGDIAAAAPLATRLLEVDPGFVPARAVLAVQAFRAEQYAVALDHIEAAAATDDPVSILSNGLLTAWIEQAMGNTDAALATIDAITGPRWYRSFKAFHSALIADVAGRTDAALAFAEAAFDLDESLGPTLAYANLLARTGNAAAAEGILTEFLEDNAGEPSATQLLLAITAGTPLTPYVDNVRRGGAQVFYDMATVIGTDDEGVTSVPYFQLALRLSPEFSNAALDLGTLLQSLGRHEEAIAVWETIEADNAYAILAATNAALSENALERPEDAIARLAPIAAEVPTDQNVAFTFANILRSENRHVETISVLTPTIDALPARRAADWPLYFIRGIAFERTGQWERAVEDFRSALLLSPNQPDVLNYLGYTWVDRGENMVEAMELINRAIAMRPDAGYIIDSLGWGYYRMGDYAQAVTLLERAVELEPGQSEINDHLGDAYWRAGRYLEAVFHWNHALAYGPETDADADLIRQKIANGLPA